MTHFTNSSAYLWTWVHGDSRVDVWQNKAMDRFAVEYEIVDNGAVVMEGRHVVLAADLEAAIDNVSAYLNGDVLRDPRRASPLMYQMTSARKLSR